MLEKKTAASKHRALLAWEGSLKKLEAQNAATAFVSRDEYVSPSWLRSPSALPRSTALEQYMERDRPGNLKPKIAQTVSAACTCMRPNVLLLNARASDAASST